jgi:hypothetical protein
MSYKTELQENNIDLQSILNTINSLPNVGESDPVLQEKTVTPTTSSQSVTPDNGYDGLSKVTVNAMPTATQATPSVSINSSGLITASATQTAGYVSAGTKTGTKQLTTQAAKTVTPSTSSQTAVASGVYTTGTVTVAAIPNTYVKPTTTKAATTYTPNTADQTIAAGTYCSGVQTIKGDSNLKAENIAEGVSIFGITGTHSGGSSGGESGGIPTCTLELSTDLAFNVICYSTVDGDGNILCERIIQPYGRSFSFTAVCKTLVYISTVSSETTMQLSNASVRYNMGSVKIFSIDANAGETASAVFTG